MNKIAVVLGIYKNPLFLYISTKAVREQVVKDYQVDIFVYDNSLDPNTLKEYEKKFPYVKITRNPINSGFAGGNNSVMREVLKDDSYKYIVLLNDDTKPSKNWLSSLIKTAEENSKVGAVTSKLIYFEPFIKISGNTEVARTLQNKKTGKKKRLGIKLYTEDTKFENTNYPKRILKKGMIGIEPDQEEKFSWSLEDFEFYLPVGEKAQKKGYSLKIKVGKNKKFKNQKITLKIGSTTKKFILTQPTETLTLKLPVSLVNKEKFNVIQNAYCKLNKFYQTIEIGNGERDKGQYNKETLVPQFCGAAVLFKAEALKQVGIFDDYFFMYYEDTDLNYRLKSKGWEIAYQPKAEVQHYHTFSSVEWSPLFYYHVKRNIVVFVMKNFGIGAIFMHWKHIFAETFRHTLWVVFSDFKNNEAKDRLSILIKVIFDLIIHTPAIYLKRFEIIKTN